MLTHKVVVGEMRVGIADTVDLCALPRRKTLVFIKAPDTLQNPLPAQHFVNTGDAAGKSMRRVKECGVGICNLLCECQ